MNNLLSSEDSVKEMEFEITLRKEVGKSGEMRCKSRVSGGTRHDFAVLSQMGLLEVVSRNSEPEGELNIDLFISSLGKMILAFAVELTEDKYNGYKSSKAIRGLSLAIDYLKASLGQDDKAFDGLIHSAKSIIEGDPNLTKEQKQMFHDMLLKNGEDSKPKKKDEDIDSDIQNYFS